MRTLIITCGLVLSAALAMASPVAEWHFDPAQGDVTSDSISANKDNLYGLYSYNNNGVSGQALKLDGFTSFMKRESAKAPKLTGPFSIEAWVALQDYPWNWTAIVDRQKDKQAGYFFGIDYQGAIGLAASIDGKWVECNNASNFYYSIIHTNGWNDGAVHTMLRNDNRLQFTIGGIGDLESAGQIPSNQWTHLTVVYSSAGKFLKFYINGRLDNKYTIGKPIPVNISEFRIGGWDAQDRSFKGKMDDLRFYNRALSDAEVADVTAAKGPSDLISWWKFDDGKGETLTDSVTGKSAKAVGAVLRPGKWDNALDLDGKGQYLEAPALGKFDELTMSVWVNPIIQSIEIPLHKWTHVVGTYDPKTGMAVYVNGQLAEQKSCTGQVTQPENTDLLIGMSHEKLCPIQTERGPSTVGSYMLLNGLLDEVKIFDKALTPDEVQKAYASATPANPKPLDYWQMPTGKPGKAEFGAVNSELNYGDGWDGQFRVSGPVDVVVKFDEMPVNYVFWHGWNYGLCMVSENGLMMADQSVERGNENGCCEHMSDKQDRYAHIDVVENNDARVVLKWRYAPCDIFYNQLNVDKNTGWADWAEENFYIYPDGVMMREQNLWTTGYVERKRVGGYGGDPSNQETLFFSQPGKGPLDTVEVGALTMANDAGESATFNWQPDFPRGVGRAVDTPTIQMVNFKSQYKPYMLRRPGATVAAFPPSGFIDRNFPFWNHWPVSMLPNDGRKGTRKDRPAHTSLAWFCEPPISNEGIYNTWIYMYGLTDKKATELNTLSKAWNSPAELTVKGQGLASQGYNTCQHAYMLTCSKPGSVSSASLVLAGSPKTPILNPAFVIKNWGDKAPKIKIDGKSIAQGPNCRIGINYELDSTDMVIWLKAQSEKPVTISLE